MIQALGWALVHFLWQGAAIALLLVLALRLLRSADANVRYLASCAALLLMLAAPLVTFLRLDQPASAPAPAALVFAPASADSTASAASIGSPATPPATPIAWLGLVVAAWALGVALLSARLAGGLIVAHRLKTWATPITSREWRGRLDRLAECLGIDSYICFFESALAEVPMAIGWLEPMILIPAVALTQLTPEQMEAILAHELAHIRRLDYPINLVQTAVETLLFYHPAVWWVGRRIREERENCCDDLAVAVCGDAVGYARALVELETFTRQAPQMAMAANGGSLFGRVKRLVTAQPGSKRNPGAGLAAILLVLAVAGTWACLAPTLHASAHNGAAAADNALARHASSAPAGAETLPVATSAPNRAQSETSTSQKPGKTAKPAQEGHTASQSSQAGSYVQEIEAAGYSNLSVDDLIAFKIQGVTPDFIRQIRESGFQPEPRQLIAMRVMGVTPEYARAMKSAFPQISVSDLIACRVQGVDPEAAKQLNSLGFGNLTARQMITARIFHIDAAAVAALKKDGFSDLTFNQAVAARVQNLSPDYVRALKDAGYPNLTFNQALRARIMGVTPEFAREAQQHGFKNLTIDKLIELKRLGVLSSQ